jgi:hypothetical protein
MVGFGKLKPAALIYRARETGAALRYDTALHENENQPRIDTKKHEFLNIFRENSCFFVADF